MVENNDALLRALELWKQGNEPAPDPAKWAREKARIKLWSLQRKICQSVEDHKKTAVPAGHGVGKSLVAATIAAWWIDSHPVGEAIVVSTAPSAVQVHAILWEEIRSIHRKGRLAGDVNLNDNWIIGKTLVGMGRKPHDYNQHAFQGVHRKYVLVVLDEACGIPEWIWNAVETITTGSKCRILAIGNPDDPASHFKKVCDPDSGWNVIPISLFDSPNFTDEKIDDDLRDVLTTREWVDDKRKSWGEDSPLWASKIEARFPEHDDYATIPLSWINQANARWLEWKEDGMPSVPGRKLISCDPARFGADATCFAHRKGDLISSLEMFRKQDTEVTASILMERLNKYEDQAVVDVIGIGAGIVDKLKHSGYRVRSFNAAARTNAEDKSHEWGFPTLRSAAWWNLRELLDPANDPTIMLPPDDLLAAELISPRWTIQLGAKIYVESKDDVKKRLGRSTDRADAVVMAFWYAAGAIDPDDNGSYNWTDQKLSGGAEGWLENDKLMEDFGIDPSKEIQW